MNIETAAREIAHDEISLENIRIANEILVNVGANMRAVRWAKGVSIRELSDRTGIMRQTISKIERGKVYPQLITVVTLAIALGVSIDEYIGFER